MSSNGSLWLPGAESEELVRDAFTWAQLTMGCLMLPIVVVGLVGNSLCIYIYTRRSMSNFINTLLAGIATSDLVLLVTGIFLYVPLTLYSFAPFLAAMLNMQV